MKPVADLTPLEAASEMEALANELARHDALYHGADAPEISDADYDALKKRNEALEAAFPELIRNNSPSRRVGAAPAATFSPVQHARPMLSLDNVFSDEDVRDFVSAIYRFLGQLPDNSIAITAEPKIDGLSMSIRYENGVMVSAATRGDGTTGENVTANIRTISEIPQVLPKGVPDVVEVRGEVYMARSDFQALNAQMAAEGKQQYVNPRNTAAGSLRQLDAKVTASRKLKFFAYAWGEMGVMPAETQMGMVNLFKDWGFPVNPLMQRFFVAEDLLAHFKRIGELRADLDYDIDGVVYKVDSLELRRSLGERANNPRWATAHKFPAEQAVTRLLGIDIQVGRTGALTPVARLEPITVGGVVVTNATLHNEDYIKGIGNKGEVLRDGRDIRVRDLVIVQRAGDVIPQIVDVLKDKRDDTSIPFQFPKYCPVCGSHAVRETGESVWRCTGGLICSAQQVERLRHFVSRGALDIEGFGDQYVELFFQENLVKRPSDIFKLRLKRTEIVNVIYSDREKKALQKERETGSVRKNSLDKDKRNYEKTLSKMFDSIDAAREVSLDRFLFALGIPNIGEGTAKAFAKLLKTANGVYEAVKLASQGRPGVGWKKLHSLNGFGEKAVEKLLAEDIDENSIFDELYNGQVFNKLKLNKTQVEAVNRNFINKYEFIRFLTLAKNDIPSEKYNDLAKANNIGTVATDSLIEFFAEEKNFKEYFNLLTELNIKDSLNSETESLFSGKTLVFTGTLTRMSRPVAIERAELLGAKTSSSVSSKTDLVIAGEKAGTKLKDAQKYGVKIITEEDWLELIKDL